MTFIGNDEGDTFTLSGTGETATVVGGAYNDTFSLNDFNANEFLVNGGGGDDTLNLEGTP